MQRERERNRERESVTDPIQICQENYILFLFVKPIKVFRIINRAPVSSSVLIHNMVSQQLSFLTGEVTELLPFILSLDRGREAQPPECQCQHRALTQLFWLRETNSQKKRKRFQAGNKISAFKCLIFSPCGFCHQIV